MAQRHDRMTDVKPSVRLDAMHGFARLARDDETYHSAAEILAADYRGIGSEDEFVAHCLDCKQTLGPMDDVIELDESAGAHEHHQNHITTGPLTTREAREKGY